MKDKSAKFKKNPKLLYEEIVKQQCQTKLGFIMADISNILCWTCQPMNASGLCFDVSVEVIQLKNDLIQDDCPNFSAKKSHCV